MKIIIDRFEGEYAVVELSDKAIVYMPKKLMPKNAKENDILEIKIDVEETKKRKNDIEKLIDDLWE